MKTLSKLKIGLIILAASLVLFLLAFFYYKSESGQIIKEKHEFLEAVTNIKLEQIVKWRTERIGDAEFFPTIGKIIKSTSELKADENNKNTKQYLSSTLKRFKDNGYFDNVFITDVNGSILFSLDSSFNTIDQLRIEELKYAVKKDTAIIGEFYFCNTHKTIHFNVASAIKDNYGNPIGVYVQVVNPYKSLYPLIQGWPVSSKSAETVVFKKVGDQVVYINELRHKKNSALSLKINLDRSEIVSVKAVLGAKGIIEGKDYRGKDVLAVVKTVPGSDWFIVSKVDKNELYSELFYRAGVISLIALITILLVSFAAFYIYKYQQSNIYKNLFFKEKELAETQEEYRTALYSIGDAVITTDTFGRIKQMNSVAETLTGWKENEVKGKSLSTVFNVINEATNKPVENPVTRVLRAGEVVGLANHTMLISKKGNKIPIADSGSPIKNSDGKIIGVVLVFRDQTEEREKEKVLIESEEKFRKAFTTSPDSININRLSDGLYITVNDGFTKMTGYRLDEVIGKSSLDINIWADVEDRKRLVAGLKEKGIVENLEARFRLKNGEVKSGLMSASIIQLADEPHILSITRDITERKIAEENIKNSEANLDALVNNNKESIWSIDKNYNYIVFNNFFAAAYLASFNQKLVKGINALNILTSELKAFWKPKYDRALSGERVEFEFSVELSNGIKFFQVLLNPIVSDGAITGVTALSIDITDKKLAEKELRENQLRLQSIVSNAPVVMFRLDKNGIFTFSEGKGLQALGLKPGEVVGLSAFELYKDYPAVVEAIQQALRGEINSAIQDMGDLVFEVNYAPVQNELGEILGIIGVANDITERKKAESEIVKRQGLISATLLSIGEALISTDSKGNVTMMNPVAEKLTGWKLAECAGRNINEVFSIINAKSGDKADNPIERTLKEGLIVGLANHTKLISKDGIEYQIADSCAPIKGENGQVLGAVLVFRNVTEEYEQREKLIISDQAIKNSINGIALSDLSGKLSFVNSSFIKMWGYSDESEILGRGADEFWNDPEDARAVIKKIFDNGFYTSELKAQKADGSLFDVLLTANFISDSDGNLKALFGSFIDITERKRIQEKLDQTRRRLESIVNSSSVLLYNCEAFGDFDATYVSDNLYALTGYTKEEFLTKGFWASRIHPEDTSVVDSELQELIKTKSVKYEYRFLFKDGTYHWMNDESNLIEDENGNPIEINGIWTDITERKKAEEDLLLKHITQRAVLNNIPDMVWLKDSESRFLAANEAFAESAGVSADRLIGKTDLDIWPKQQAESYREDDVEVMSSKRQKKIVEQVIDKHGNITWVETIKSPVLDDGDNVLGTAGTARDITERRRSEEALRKSEDRYRILSKNTSDFTFACIKTEKGYKIEWMAGATSKLTGYTIAELIEKGCWRFLVHPEDDELFKKNVIEIPAGKNSECELRIISKEGALKWIRVNTTCLHAEEKNTDVVYGGCSDITAQKIAEESLRTSEQKYRLLFETNPHPLWVYDLETFAFLAVNDAAIAKYGYTKDEFMSMTIKQIRPQEDIEKLIDNVKNVTEGLDNAGVWRHKKKDGSIIHVEIVSHTLNFEGRNAEMILSHDVTEKIQAEQKLKESQARLSLALSSTKQGIYDLNVQTGEAIVTPEYVTMLGYDPGSFKESNENWIERLHPDDREITAKAYLDYIEGKTAEYRVEFRQRTADNQWKWILSLGKIVEYDANGKPLRMLGTHTDITIQKNAEKDVLRLSRAVEQSPAIIMITNTDGDIEYVNPKFTEVTGYTFNEVIGKNPRLLKSGHNTTEEYRILWETITKHEEWRGEFYNKKKNGELYWESAFISPLINENGKVTNYIAVKEDITERKKVISDLIEAKTKADEMNRVKAYFFANMSHELRTPFVGIMGFSEMLAESLNNPAEKEMAEQILRSSKRLTETLNKILNVTRLEFDKVDVKISDVDIVELIKRLTILFSKSGTIKNTVIGNTFTPEIIRVKTDAKLLEEILTNLLNNAIKYTANGAIEVISKITSNLKGDKLIIQVADTGIGIPKEKQDIIWQEFRQVSEGMNRSFEGTGLGLTIIKKYVYTLGGNITLDSEVGRGSTFTIELPVTNLGNKEVIVQKVDEPVKTLISNVPLSRKPKILYVEDDVIALSFVEKVLRSLYDIDTAYNAAIALNFTNNNKYEVVLLDINLGKGIDGVELMQMMRKIEGYSKIPMIAVTAYAAESDRLDFLAKGFTHYLSKPFTSVELRAILNRIFN